MMVASKSLTAGRLVLPRWVFVDDRVTSAVIPSTGRSMHVLQNGWLWSLANGINRTRMIYILFIFAHHDLHLFDYSCCCGQLDVIAMTIISDSFAGASLLSTPCCRTARHYHHHQSLSERFSEDEFKLELAVNATEMRGIKAWVFGSIAFTMQYSRKFLHLLAANCWVS